MSDKKPQRKFGWPPVDRSEDDMKPLPLGYEWFTFHAQRLGLSQAPDESWPHFLVRVHETSERLGWPSTHITAQAHTNWAWSL